MPRYPLQYLFGFVADNSRRMLMLRVASREHGTREPLVDICHE